MGEVIVIPFPRSKSAAGRSAEVLAAIDRLGLLSSKAQNLNVPITSVLKLENSKFPLVIYLLRLDDEYVGILKIGMRVLYFHDGRDMRKFSPICVLDFFVTQQRRGWGKQLFGVMIKHQRIAPHALAYDRPSASMFAFLGTHMDLVDLCMQGNKFAVASKFFSESNEGTTVDCEFEIIKI